MDRPKVVVAEAIADVGVGLLRVDCEVVDAVGASRDELERLVADAAGLIVRSATDVDAGLLAGAPRLEVIGRAGIGVDNIDVDAATAAGVLVVNAPNANTISAAEHTMALLLAQARRIAEADASLRRGAWERKRFQGVELHGKVLGVIGLGRIGTLVASRAQSFGMRVVAHDPYIGAERAKRLGVELATLDELYAVADFITVHLPRTEATEGLIDAEAFAAMKPGVRLINVARGGIVDEQALSDAVATGRVAGAAVDVFAVEPTTSSPLFELPQVVVTPHLGASTQEAQDKAGVSVAEAVAAALRGELVLSAVNVDLGPQVSDEIRPYLPLAEALGRIFTGFSRGLPSTLTVSALGRLAEWSTRPLTLATLKGALQAVSETPISYVNAPVVAEAHGISVDEHVIRESHDYQSMIRLTGIVNGKPRSVAGIHMERKGLVLAEVDDYEIELPITDHMLLIRNDDVPGVIGRVGTLLGDVRVNIADMVVGRHPGGAAMMGLALDGPLTEDALDALLKLDGVAAARYLRPFGG